MVPNKVSEQLHIGADKLKEYEANGLLGDTAKPDRTSDNSDRLIQRICLINFLLDSGMEMKELKAYLHLLDEKTENREEQIRMLRKRRCSLLEEIHIKQQILDKPDYMIRETKKDSRQ